MPQAYAAGECIMEQKNKKDMQLVNVWMMAYNHEEYIVQAIESVLMQETNFDFQIVIGEDCSKDHTREIILSYKKKYPEKFRVYLPDKNIGMVEMDKATYQLCNGKYIAWLDGDDYWTDPLKLQKQVDIMEANPDLVMCFHKVTILNESTGKTHYFKEPDLQNNNNVLTIKDFFEVHCSISTPSVLVKHILPPVLPDWFYTLPYTDRGYYYLLLEKGNAKYLSADMAVYRKHKAGAWSGTDKLKQAGANIKFYKILLTNFNSHYREPIKNKLRKLAWKNFQLNLKTKNYWQGIKDLNTILLNSI